MWPGEGAPGEGDDGPRTTTIGVPPPAAGPRPGLAGAPRAGDPRPVPALPPHGGPPRALRGARHSRPASAPAAADPRPPGPRPRRADVAGGAVAPGAGVLRDAGGRAPRVVRPDAPGAGGGHAVRPAGGRLRPRPGGPGGGAGADHRHPALRAVRTDARGLPAVGRSREGRGAQARRRGVRGAAVLRPPGHGSGDSLPEAGPGDDADARPQRVPRHPAGPGHRQAAGDLRPVLRPGGIHRHRPGGPVGDHGGPDPAGVPLPRGAGPPPPRGPTAGARSGGGPG